MAEVITNPEKAYQQVQDIAGKAVAGAAESSRNITVRSAANDQASKV